MIADRQKRDGIAKFKSGKKDPQILIHGLPGEYLDLSYLHLGYSSSASKDAKLMIADLKEKTEIKEGNAKDIFQLKPGEDVVKHVDYARFKDFIVVKPKGNLDGLLTVEGTTVVI